LYYNLPNKTKTELHLRTFGDASDESSLRRYADTIATLSFSRDPPSKKGCAIVTVNDKCSAHIVLAGLVDPAKEVSRLEKKMAALAATADKLEKAAKVDGYETKVPEEVRAANKEKLSQTRTEVERLTEAIKALRAM